MVQQLLLGQDLLVLETSRSHSDTPRSVGILWTNDQPDVGTSTRQPETPTRDRHPCPPAGIEPGIPAREKGSEPCV
jgi:hypothetical protein